jgi:hypothetical protein
MSQAHEEVNLGERGSESDETRRGHGWLQRGNLFVDITADQFKDAPGKVIVEVNSKWHGTFEVNRPISPEVIKSWTGPGTGYPPLYDQDDQVMRHVVNS